MKLGVVGGGCVGHATARAFIEHVDEVRVWDVVKERATHTFADVLYSDLIFICLPETAVDGFFEQVNQYGSLWLKKNFVIKSTVPIGTTRRLREKYGLESVCHSPEFLTARCSVTDAQIPARNIIGDPLIAKDWVPCSRLLHGLYSKRFPGVPNYLMTCEESEAVKLLTNGFFAVKLAYWNECRHLADAHGMDWERVMAAVLADGRIAHAHTRVPGHDGRGFGGACLPKDLANLIHCLESAPGCTAQVTKAALERNELDRSRPIIAGRK